MFAPNLLTWSHYACWDYGLSSIHTTTPSFGKVYLSFKRHFQSFTDTFRKIFAYFSPRNVFFGRNFDASTVQFMDKILLMHCILARWDSKVLIVIRNCIVLVTCRSMIISNVVNDFHFLYVFSWCVFFFDGTICVFHFFSCNVIGLIVVARRWFLHTFVRLFLFFFLKSDGSTLYVRSDEIGLKSGA